MRCKEMVKMHLDNLEISHTSIELGAAELDEHTTRQKLAELKQVLNVSGLELIADYRDELVERIKEVVAEMIHQEDTPEVKFTEYISNKLGHDYRHISGEFFHAEGITITSYRIRYKIEYVKKLLTETTLHISQIALMLNYSSAAHLSQQFKKITGVTASSFREQTMNSL